MPRVPLAEQQTTIAMDRLDDMAVIFSSDTIMVKKLKALAAKYPDDYIITEYDEAIECRIPKGLIRFGHSPSPKAIENGKRVARQRDAYLASERAKYN